MNDFEYPRGVITGNNTAGTVLSKRLAYVVAGNLDIQLAGAGNLGIGVLLEDVEGYGQGRLATAGIVKILSGGAVSKQDAVKIDASGKVVTTLLSTDRIGIALNASTGADELIPIMLK